MRPEDLKHVKIGDSIKAAEWNALVDGVQPKPAYTAIGNNIGGQVTGDPSTVGDPSFLGVNTGEVDIPAFSVFSIKADEDSENYDGRPLRFVVDQVSPVAINTSTLRLFTNPFCEIPGNGGEAAIKAIGNTIPRLVWFDPNDPDFAPKVGHLCGPEAAANDEEGEGAAFGVTLRGLGLLCLGLIRMDINAGTDDEDSESSSSDGPTHAVVVAAFEASSFIVKITEEVTAFDTDTMSLGTGLAKVQYRAGLAADAIDIGDAPNPSDAGEDWEFRVFSLRTAVIAVDDVVEAHNTAGIGLLIPAGSGGGCQPGEDSGSGCVTDFGCVTLADLPVKAATLAFSFLAIDENGCACLVQPNNCPADDESSS